MRALRRRQHRHDTRFDQGADAVASQEIVGTDKKHHAVSLRVNNSAAHPEIEKTVSEMNTEAFVGVGHVRDDPRR